jgi:hypothetical protein
VPLLLLGPPFFRLFFLCPPPVKWDDWHLLACAMASGFSVAWHFSQREHLIKSTYLQFLIIRKKNFWKLLFVTFLY